MSSTEHAEVLGEDGTIRAKGLPAGPVDVWLTSDVYAAVPLSAVELAKGPPNLHEIRFSPGGTLKIHVSSADGKAVCNAKIILKLPDGSPAYSGYPGPYGSILKKSSFNTDTEGNCTCDRVLEGKIRVRVEAEGHAEVTQEVNVEDAKETSLAIAMKKN